MRDVRTRTYESSLQSSQSAGSANLTMRTSTPWPQPPPMSPTALRTLFISLWTPQRVERVTLESPCASGMAPYLW